jgi:hypothetical protein
MLLATFLLSTTYCKQEAGQRSFMRTDYPAIAKPSSNESVIKRCLLCRILSLDSALTITAFLRITQAYWHIIPASQVAKK